MRKGNRVFLLLNFFAIALAWKWQIDSLPKDIHWKSKLGDRMIKQLLNSVITKYCDLSVSRRSIICLRLRLRQIIDLLATDKSRYFAQPRPIIVNYLVFSGDLDMHCSGSLNLSHLTNIVKIYSFKNGPLEELWGWGWGFFEPHENCLVWIFYAFVWTFLTLLGVHEYFSFNFPPHEYFFFVLRPPPPTPLLPHQFSNGPSLNYEYAQNFHMFNVCK